MLLKLSEVLSESEVAEVRGIVEQANFIDGTVSGKGTLKKNLQMDRGGPAANRSVQMIVKKLMARADFTAYASPKQITMEFNRYEPGMYYKNHMDAAVMGGLHGQPMRSDLSFTVFLTDPDSYQGGEFVLQSPYGEERIKGAAGDAIVYPSNMIHRVEPIESGARWAAIGWIQSMLRGDAERQIIHEVLTLREEVVRAFPDSEYQERFDRLHGNLMRLWAEV
jgi:PKHD-type hydroxylase